MIKIEFIYDNFKADYHQGTLYLNNNKNSGNNKIIKACIITSFIRVITIQIKEYPFENTIALVGLAPIFDEQLLYFADRLS